MHTNLTMKRKYQKLSNYGDTISELAALHSRRMEPERLKCPSGSAKYIRNEFFCDEYNTSASYRSVALR